MMLGTDTRILIVGLGLIGGSYAEGLKKAGFEVGAITRSRKTLDYALEKGIVDSGTIEVTREYVSRFDIVVFALYPHVFLSWIRDYQDFIKSGALLTDVTGVKRAVVYEVQGMLRPDLEFVGAHPMAGREVYGVENADCSIFEGANYIVTPTEANTEAAVRTCEDLGRALGFGCISRLSPESHDEMIGFLSQLTHCIAVALMNSKESHHLVDFTGDSFRDLTRIARINDGMWSELFMLNRDELLSQMDLFSEKFGELRDALAAGDTDKMREMMRISTERRGYFDKKD
jgi:prephenate dehydrogenase